MTILEQEVPTFNVQNCTVAAHIKRAQKGINSTQKYENAKPKPLLSRLRDKVRREMSSGKVHLPSFHEGHPEVSNNKTNAAKQFWAFTYSTAARLQVEEWVLPRRWMARHSSTEKRTPALAECPPSLRTPWEPQQA
eukprot:RCo050900